MQTSTRTATVTEKETWTRARMPVCRARCPGLPRRWRASIMATMQPHPPDLPVGRGGAGTAHSVAGSVSISLPRRGGQVPKDRQAAGPPLLVPVAGWGLPGPARASCFNVGAWARRATAWAGMGWRCPAGPLAGDSPPDASGTNCQWPFRSGGRRAPGRRWIGARSRTARHVASSVALSGLGPLREPNRAGPEVRSCFELIRPPSDTNATAHPLTKLRQLQTFIEVAGGRPNRCFDECGLAPFTGHICPGLGSPSAFHICTRTQLSPATSAPGLGSSLQHLHQDSAHPCHICAGS